MARRPLWGSALVFVGLLAVTLWVLRDRAEPEPESFFALQRRVPDTLLVAYGPDTTVMVPGGGSGWRIIRPVDFPADDIILNAKEGSRRRRAIIWRRLGLVQKGAQKAAISEEDLVGRECAVEVKVVEYPKRDGTTGTKNEVTFAGYKSLDEYRGEESGEKLDESSCPF